MENGSSKILVGVASVMIIVMFSYLSFIEIKSAFDETGSVKGSSTSAIPSASDTDKEYAVPLVSPDAPSDVMSVSDVTAVDNQADINDGSAVNTDNEDANNTTIDNTNK